MMQNLPAYITVLFELTTVATLLLFYRTLRSSSNIHTSKRSALILLCLFVWLVLQGLVTLRGIYSADTMSLPPKIALLGILPALLAILLLFVTPGGRSFADSLPLRALTWIHTVRVPVELVLYWLYVHKAVPELMTFAGRNFDILAGLTAPLVAYFGLAKRMMGRRALLAWNFIALALLLNIVVNAFLSAPTPLQKFAFDQPNTGILYFPFSWLPVFIVPVVLLSHLVAIRQLSRKQSMIQEEH